MNQDTATTGNYDLKDVDIIRERMPVSYTDARDALKATGGNIVDALAWLEEHGHGSEEKLTGLGEHVSEKVQKALQGRDVADVRLKLVDTAVASLPVSAAGIAAALVVFVAEMVSNCSIDVKYASEAERSNPEAPK
ncbi:MAG: hypothetical protein ACLFWB_00230 [Armatimonadota bacterium]